MSTKQAIQFLMEQPIVAPTKTPTRTPIKTPTKKPIVPSTPIKPQPGVKPRPKGQNRDIELFKEVRR